MYSCERMIFSRLGGSKDIHITVKASAAKFIAEIKKVCFFTVLKHDVNSCATLSILKTPVIRIVFRNRTVMQRLSAE